METMFPLRLARVSKEILDFRFLLPEPDVMVKYPDVEPGLKEEVPWSDSLTTYDREHFRTYLRFVDASADNASYEEMAQIILGIDPV
ncbi:hypothetical protein [Mesorhizobium sp. M0678]|uniref:hypothetical protein n=1 Tax=Mesorhizobium sp. M0678 TaxID=2956985 RepID=UPI00333A60A3